MSPYLLVFLLFFAACVPQGPELPNVKPTPTPSDGTDPTDPGEGDPGDATDPVSQTWWKPRPNTRFQIMSANDGDYVRQLKSGTQLVEIEAVKDYGDLKEEIEALQSKGVKVLCYQSLSYEDWRHDIGDFPVKARGKSMDGWDGEWWTDTRATSPAHAFWDARYEEFARAGCDCVEDDNMVDPNDNDTGFPLTRAEGKAGIKRRADKAHSLGMCYIAKNNPSMSADYAEFCDGVMIEEAGRYNEREDYLPWKEAGKFAGMIEYSSKNCKPYPGFSVQYHPGNDYFDGVNFKVCD